MKRVTLIANRSRSDFAQLEAVARKIARLVPETEVEVASNDTQIESVAQWNVSRLPVLAVDGEALIVLNPRSDHVEEVVRHIVA